MPSLRSSVFRLFVKYYLGPQFSLNKSIEEHRKAFESISKLSLLPSGTKTEFVSIDDNIKAEWVSVGNATDDKIILYLHGGAYTFGSINTHRDIAARLSKYSRFRVLVLDYRLAPEYPYPAAIEDSTNAFRWLVKGGILPRNIAIAGDSAGGTLAVVTMLSLRDNGDPLPGSAVCFSPWTDLEGGGESSASKIDIDPMVKPEWLRYMASFYACENDLKHPLVSPIYANLKNLPPMLIQVGCDEVLLSDSERLATIALEAGVDVKLDRWKNMWHVWQFFGGAMPEAAKALKEAGDFIRKSSN